MARRNPYIGDARTRLAKAQGYPARSVWKLEEIDRRVGLFRGKRRVLDLGAAPGSWSLYAAQRLPADGRVLAIDLQLITQSFPPNVEVVQGDALSLDSTILQRHAPYDLILSDMAPKTSGTKIEDQLRSYELFARAVEVAVAFGSRGADFVGKLFMSAEFEAARSELGRHFNKVRVLRPEGTRQVSSELFLIGQGLGSKAPNRVGQSPGDGHDPNPEANGPGE